MGKVLANKKAEQEADKIGLRFAHSSDVLGDMEKAYDADFSGVKIHTDAAADAFARGAGRDAVAKGQNIYFAGGIYESHEPAANALVGHELAHVMQQTGQGEMDNSVAEGAEQGGLLDWFKSKLGFSTKNKVGSRDKRQMTNEAYRSLSGLAPQLMLKDDVEVPYSPEQEELFSRIMRRDTPEADKIMSRVRDHNYTVTGDTDEAIEEPIFRSFTYITKQRGLKDMRAEEMEAMLTNLAADDREQNLRGLNTYKTAAQKQYDYLENKYGYEPPNAAYIFSHYDDVLKDAGSLMQIGLTFTKYRELFDPNNPDDMRMKAQASYYGVLMPIIKMVDKTLFMTNKDTSVADREAWIESMITENAREGREYLKNNPKRRR